MKKSTIVAFTIIFSSLVYSYIGCGVNNRGEEENFKKAAKKLIKLQKKALTVKDKWENIGTVDGKHVMISKHEKTKRFFEKNRGTREEIVSGLREIIERNPNGRWSDDALFCIVITNSMFLKLGEPYTTRTIQTGREYLEKYLQGQIEEWTIRNIPTLKFMFSLDSRVSPYFSEITTPATKIKTLVYGGIFQGLLKKGGLQAAEEELELLKGEHIEKEIIESLNGLITGFKEVERFTPKSP